MSNNQFRTHAKLMVQFAMDPSALVFVSLGTVAGTEYFVYADFPLWEDSRTYVVRSDMTIEEAQDDRAETVEQYQAHKAANDKMIEAAHDAIEALR